MGEGVAVAGQVAPGVYDDPDSPPPPDPDRAPKGWTWRRASSSWQPAQRQARGRGAVPLAAVSRETPRAAEDAPAAAGTTLGAAAGAEQDPAPAWAGSGGDSGADVSRETPPSGSGGRLAFADVPESVKDDITGLIGLVALPVLSLLQAIDPYCFGALGDCLDPAVEAALPLICRSSRVVAYFADDSNDWLLWGKLALALKPVGRAIVEHHILGRVHLVRDPQTGRRLVEPGRPAAAAGDPLQPHVQPAYQYAA